MALRNNIQALLDIATERFQQEWTDRYLHSFEKEWNENESKNFINSKEGSKLSGLCSKQQLKSLNNGNVKKWDLILLQIAFTQTDWPKTKKLTKREQSRVKSLAITLEIRNRIIHKTLETSKDLNSDFERLKKILIDDLGCDSERIDEQVKIYKAPENLQFEIVDSKNDAKALELREKANKLFGEKKWNEALKIYNEAISLEKISKSEKAKLFSNRAATFINLTQYDSALADAEEVIKLFPEWPRGYVRKGDSLLGKKENQKARREFEFALVLNPLDEALPPKISNFSSNQSEESDGNINTQDPKFISEYALKWNSFSSTDSKLNDLNRFEVLISYRKAYGMQMKSVATYPYQSVVSFDNGVYLAHIADNNFKPITLSEMNILDHTYKNRKLIGRLIVHSFKMSDKFSVIEDCERNVQRVGFSFLSDSDWHKKLRIGNLIEIINPHLRLAMDGKPALKVEHPESFRVIENKNICNFCSCTLSLETTKRCSKCKTPYCSQECQLRDWKELQHKLVCMV